MKYLKRIMQCVITVFLIVHCISCKNETGREIISKQYDIVDLFIGDVINPRLTQVPDGIKESDYTWTITSEVYGKNQTGLKEIGTHEYEAIKSDFVTICAEVNLEGKTYRESFRYYIYPAGDIVLNQQNHYLLGDQNYISVTVRFPDDMVEKGFDVNRITVEPDENLLPYYKNMTAIGIERGKEIPYRLEFASNDTDFPVTGTIIFKWGKSEAACEVSLFNEKDPFQAISYMNRTGGGAKVNDDEVVLSDVSTKYNSDISRYENQFGSSGSGKYVIVSDGQVMVNFTMNLPAELRPDSAEDVDYIITAVEGNPIQVVTLRNGATEDPVPGLVSTCDIVLIDAKTGVVLDYLGHYEGEMKDKYADNAYTVETEEVYLGYAEPDFNEVIKGIWEERSVSVILK